MKKVHMKKDFRGREVYQPIIDIKQCYTDLQSGDYVVVEENTSGKFLFNQHDAKTYFVPNQQYEKVASKLNRNIR